MCAISKSCHLVQEGSAKGLYTAKSACGSLHDGSPQGVYTMVVCEV